MKPLPGGILATLPDPLETKSISMLQTTTDTHAAESRRQRLNGFLGDVEKRAYRMAQISTYDSDEAMDIVQDAMISLVSKYGARPEEEWRPLFYRILGNRINDWHRRRKIRARFHFWSASSDADDQTDTEHNIAHDAPDTNPAPHRVVSDSESFQHIEEALAALPTRQQQAFMLRLWEGMSVKETATAMNCSEGSVKTHLSRALKSMRAELGADSYE